MTLLETMNSIFENQFLTNIVIAIIILLIGFIIGKLLGKLVSRVLHEIETDKIAKKAGTKIKLEKSIGSLTAYLIYFIAILMALDQLGIKTIVLYILAIAVLAVLVLSVLLGIKDFIPNMFAGFFIYRKDLVKKGDKIKVHGVQGKVEKISLIETTVRTKNGDTVLIPNSTLTKEEIVKLKK